MEFKNPNNDYIESAGGSVSWLWVLLFGPFYWAVKGVWRHFIIHLFLALVTFGVVHFIYPFFVYSILEKHYREWGGNWALGVWISDTSQLEKKFSKVRVKCTLQLVLWLVLYWVWVLVFISFLTLEDLIICWDWGDHQKENGRGWAAVRTNVSICWDWGDHQKENGRGWAAVRKNVWNCRSWKTGPRYYKFHAPLLQISWAPANFFKLALGLQLTTIKSWVKLKLIS